MPKRFIDTELWKKTWFMDLSPSEKCAWIYLTTAVDVVGVWTPNYKLASFTIGADVDWEALLLKLNGNVEVLESGKWWLPDFCEFQYGKLVHSYEKWAAGEDVRGPHKGYIELLIKHGLLERVIRMGYTLSANGIDKGYTVSVNGYKNKNKTRTRLEKEEEKEHGEYVRLTATEYKKLTERYGAANAKKAIDKLNNAIGAKGYKYKSHYRAILNWVMDAIGAQPIAAQEKKICPECKKEYQGTGCRCGWFEGANKDAIGK